MERRHMYKALLLATAAVLAACSRNAKPGVGGTGRADTTMVTDTTMPHHAPVDTVAPLPRRDTIGVRSDTTRPDTSVAPPVPYPTDTSGVKRDTSGAGADSASVPHKAD